MALVQQVDEDLLHPRSVALDVERDVESRGKTTLMPRFCACGSIIVWHSRMISGSELASSDSDSFPDSISARSRISLISSSRYHPACRIWSMLRFCETVGGGDARFHELGETENRAQRRAELVAHAGKEVRLREVGLFRDGHRLVQLQLDLLPHRIVGADQQVADDVAVVVAQRRDRHDRGKAAAVLADVRQFIDVFDAARRLEAQARRSPARWWWQAPGSAPRRAPSLPADRACRWG